MDLLPYNQDSLRGHHEKLYRASLRHPYIYRSSMRQLLQVHKFMKDSCRHARGEDRVVFVQTLQSTTSDCCKQDNSRHKPMSDTITSRHSLTLEG